ncbi:MarR family winged helix-turn-helix transcriptional regulator [Sphingobium yanoikuyae]|jgi:DNA-binding MarR family transcriptional regulator|uniref:MarR family winged helix-turn-helix transcriptional regulator n=1 Tax=Sphingobium yanoikuyae TaxID=13690 RepID=UPI002FDD4063
MSQTRDNPDQAMEAFAEDALAVQTATDRRDYSAVHFGILQHIGRSTNGATPGDLAARWKSSATGISRILAAMDKAGHVGAVLDERDRRVRRYFLTDAGFDLIARWFEAKGYTAEVISGVRAKFALTNPFMKGKKRG